MKRAACRLFGGPVRSQLSTLPRFANLWSSGGKAPVLSIHLIRERTSPLAARGTEECQTSRGAVCQECARVAICTTVATSTQSAGSP